MEFDITDFRLSMINAGIQAPEVIQGDGRLHRFHVYGDRKNSKNGWYILFPDYPPSGIFGCWSRNIKQKWAVKNINKELYGKNITKYTVNSFVNQKSEQEAIYIKGRKIARDIWNCSESASENHLYLVKKGIRPIVARQKNGNLVLPVLDASGAIHGIQFINKNGKKWFSPGTKKQGHFCPIGLIEGAETIYIAEGFATAITIHEATRVGVVVAWDAGNILSVTQALKIMYPIARLVIAGDDDRQRSANPGREKATEAAKVCDCIAIFPSQESGTDWNDLFQTSGLMEVRRQIEDKLASPMQLSAGFARRDDSPMRRDDSPIDSNPSLRQKHHSPAIQSKRIFYSTARSMDKLKIDYVLPGLKSGNVGVFAAPGGTGKGFAMLQIGAALAAPAGIDIPLLGVYPAPESRGRVLILTAEEDDEIMHNRMVSLGNFLDIEGYGEDVHKELNDRLVVYSLFGENPCLLNRNGEDDSFTKRSTEWLESMCEGNRLVFVDTLSRFHCAEENSNRDMTRLIQKLEKITNKLGTTIVCTHHFNKNSSMANSSIGQEAVRGASAIPSSVRWLLNMQTITSQEAKTKGIAENQKEWFVDIRFSKLNHSQPVGSQVVRRLADIDCQGAGAGGFFVKFDGIKNKWAPTMDVPKRRLSNDKEW